MINEILLKKCLERVGDLNGPFTADDAACLDADGVPLFRTYMTVGKLEYEIARCHQIVELLNSAWNVYELLRGGK